MKRWAVGRGTERLSFGRHSLLDASIARWRKGSDFAIGVGRLFSVDSRGVELCKPGIKAGASRLNQARVESEWTLANQPQTLRVGMFRVERKIPFFAQHRGGHR